MSGDPKMPPDFSSSSLLALSSVRRWNDTLDALQRSLPSRSLLDAVDAATTHVRFAEQLRTAALNTITLKPSLADNVLAATRRLGDFQNFAKNWSDLLTPSFTARLANDQLTNASTRLRDAALSALQMPAGLDLARALTEQSLRTSQMLEAVQRTARLRDLRLLEIAFEAEAALTADEAESGGASAGSTLLSEGVAIIAVDIANATVPSEVRSAVDRLVEMIGLRLQRVTSAIEADKLALVIAILALMLQVLTTIDDQKFEEELLDATRAAPLQIAATIEGLERAHHQLIQHPRGVVTTRAHLRSHPTRQGSSLLILNAFDEVDFLEAKDGWIKVQYYDDATDVVVTGWIYGRYLRVLTADK